MGAGSPARTSSKRAGRDFLLRLIARHGLEGAHEAECCVDFIDVAVGLDPRVIFPDPSTAEQASVPGIARLCVDLGGRRIIKKTRASFTPLDLALGLWL